MTGEKLLKEQLIIFLTNTQAHMRFADGIKDFPMNAINTVYPNGTYSPWQLLEHIRRTQHDSIQFIMNQIYCEKKWPKDYRSSKKLQATPSDWERTI